LARLREAYLMDRSNTSILSELADLAERHGDEKRAVEALRELGRLSPDDENIAERLTQIKRKSIRKLELRRQMDDNE
jgi:hypothetical protein